ncbi:MAG: hypothetical protein QME12_08655 [Nanoarchaeota archaeon]|nr:hypothetical protein [Nanoarchaeota archaeon]
MRENGITIVPLCVVDAVYAKSKDKAFSRALLADVLSNNSVLNGNSKDLNYHSRGRAFGVRATQGSGLETSVANALSQGIVFEHNGLMYVPVNPKVFRK